VLEAEMVEGELVGVVPVVVVGVVGVVGEDVGFEFAQPAPRKASVATRDRAKERREKGVIWFYHITMFPF
jgi:hypothetical protein